MEGRTDMSSYSREDKLYILAHNLQNNKLTPDSPAYKGFIKKICCSHLSMSLDAVNEYTEILTTAYSADKWQGILIPIEEESLADNTPSTPTQSEDKTPSQNILKTLTLTGQSEPIKTVPHKNVQQPQYSPKTIAQTLLQLARNDDFNGVGRLMLAEVRRELQDPSLQLQDIIRLLNQYAPQMTIEPRPKNTVFIYFNGKNTQRRPIRMIEPETLALSFTEEE